jgi:hypothetical protein
VIDPETLLAALALDGTAHSEKAIHAAFQHARSLARSVIDEPAALFYAFATRRRAVPPYNRRFAAFVAREQLRDIAATLDANDDDLITLGDRALHGEVDYEDVRAWFAERMPMN